MYFSQVLLRNVAGLRWDQLFGDERNVNYGRTVIVGSGRVPLNPVASTYVLAYGLADGSNTGQRLAELYPIWARMLQPDG